MSDQFVLYQSNSLTSLAEQFALSLKRYRVNPLKSESVIIQTTGMETWLTQQCARINNIFAAVDFTRPAKFLLKLNAILTGQSEERTVFESENMRWFIYREITENPQRYPLVEQYLSGGEGQLRQQKLFAFASETAEMLDSYILYRPDMLEAWEQDKFAADPMGTELFSSQEREHEAWQRRIWQEMLRFHKESENPGQNPVTVLSNLGRILAAPTPSDELIRWSRSVPVVALFGMSVLPPRYMELFKLLSRHCRVELYVINPSRFYWSDILTDRQVIYRKKQMQLCNPDKEYLTMGNRLLRNLGESGRDFFHTLYDTAESVNIHEAELFREPAEGTLLGEIQRDILEWHDDGREEPVNLQGDDSVTVNRCYTPFREVEVLYDYLLSCFEKDPSLTLGDILIVTPDIETYAPLITLQFSRHSRLSGSVADRSAIAQSSVLQLVKEILLLPETTFSAPVVISLFEQYVRFTGEELSIQEEQKVKRWVEESSIRWGVDGAFWKARAGSEFGSDRFSWKSGMTRMFQGFAGGDGSFDVPSYSEIEGSDGELLGRLASFVRTVTRLRDMSGRSLSVQEWSAVLTSWFRELFLFDEGENEDMSDPVLSQIIQRVQRLELQVAVTLMENSSLKIRFSTIRSALFTLLEEEEGSQGFLRGDITFASTLPLRSIPFRIVGCIGLNYDLFPRVGNALSFDLIRASRQRGDRDTRQNDLYLFLETIISAEDKFYMSCTAFNEKSGEEQPPSSVVDQLESYIEENYHFNGESPLRTICTTHPLHPFSLEYLREGCKLFTYQKRWFPSIAQEKLFEESLFTHELSVETNSVSSLTLINYLTDPLKDLFENLLSFRLPKLENELPEEEPFKTDNLRDYILRDAALRSAVQGTNELKDVTDTLYFKGELPAGAAYEVNRMEIEAAVEGFMNRIPQSIIGQQPEKDSFKGEIGGVTFMLESDLLYSDGETSYLIDAGDLRYTKKTGMVEKLKRYFRLYLSHLIGNSRGEKSTMLITRDSRVHFPALTPEEARSSLEQLVTLYTNSRLKFLPYLGGCSNELYSQGGTISELLSSRVEKVGFGRVTDLYEQIFYERHRNCFTPEIEYEAARLAKMVFSPIEQLQGGK